MSFKEKFKSTMSLAGNKFKDFAIKQQAHEKKNSSQFDINFSNPGFFEDANHLKKTNYKPRVRPMMRTRPKQIIKYVYLNRPSYSNKPKFRYGPRIKSRPRRINTRRQRDPFSMF
jgi:hypothetical protein